MSITVLMEKGVAELETPFILYGFEKSNLHFKPVDTVTPASDDDELPF